MSELQNRLLQQTIVPAYVWHDTQQQGAVLTRMGRVAVASAASGGKLAKLDDATVAAHPLMAVVGHCDVNGVDVPFVAYEKIADVERADLFLVMLDVEFVEATTS